jgi:HEPN domain-containing protein
MNRADLLLMKDERLADAQALLAAGRWAFAYYTAGYAVECALKSCVLARMIHTGAVFEDKLPVFRVHSPDVLVGLSGLRDELNRLLRSNSAFQQNWTTAKAWTEESRYVTTTPRATAEKLIQAITEEPDGVFAWLRQHW